MELDSIHSKADIQACVSLYAALNDFSFLNADEAVAYKNLLTAAKKQHFIRVLRENNRIIAWAWFIKTQSLHMKESQYQQHYFASNQTGIKAARCVKLLHRAAIEEAKTLDVAFVISQGSHMDENNIFAKILEKDGWLRRGHTAVFKLPQRVPKPVGCRSVFSR